MPENRGRKGNVVMAKEVYAEDLLEDFIAYEKKKDKKEAHSQDYIDNMELFMRYLTEVPKAYNLTVTKECRLLQEFAMEIVAGSKKDYPLLKATKVERGKFFNSFVDYLRSQYRGPAVKLEKIPFVMNELERKLDLVKHYREYYLAADKLPKPEIAKKYYVDEKTLRNDNKEIKAGALNAFGQKIDIEYDEETKCLFSTPVPIFTVQNITQIVTILNGLGYMYQKVEYQQYALFTAVIIWNQLADTVKHRIRDELVELLDLDEEWYEKIANETSFHFKGFYSERDMYHPESGNLLMCFKNSLPTDIVYDDGIGIKHLEGVHICYCDKDDITVDNHGERICIKKENLIKVCENGN